MSEASTIPATEEQLAAARALPRPPVQGSGLSTPEDKIIRRQSTQVLPGHVGDTPILATAAAEHQLVKVEVSKKGKDKPKESRSVKKKHVKKASQGKRGKKSSGGKKAITKKAPPGTRSTPPNANGTLSQQPGSVVTAPQPNHPTAPETGSAPKATAACRKAAAKKPAEIQLAQQQNASNVPPAPPVKVEPMSERRRRRTEVQTPPSVREARHAAQAELANMNRSTTLDQLKSPQAPQTQNGPPATTNKQPNTGPEFDDYDNPSEFGDLGTPRYEVPSEDGEDDDQDEEESGSASEDSEPEEPGTSNAADPPPAGKEATATEKKGKKGKKPKTPEQKAAHARYMKFSRSLKSTFAAS